MKRAKHVRKNMLLTLGRSTRDRKLMVLEGQCTVPGILVYNDTLLNTLKAYCFQHDTCSPICKIITLFNNSNENRYDRSAHAGTEFDFQLIVVYLKSPRRGRPTKSIAKPSENYYKQLSSSFCGGRQSSTNIISLHKSAGSRFQQNHDRATDPGAGS